MFAGQKLFHFPQRLFGRSVEVDDFSADFTSPVFRIVAAERGGKRRAVTRRVVDLDVNAVLQAILRFCFVPQFVRHFEVAVGKIFDLSAAGKMVDQRKNVVVSDLPGIEKVTTR